MDDTKLPKDQLIPDNKDKCDHLLNEKLPNISLPNQDGNLLKIKRSDTFRLVIYFYSMTGHPKKKITKKLVQDPRSKWMYIRKL